jgi:23S rRNA (adenine2503-C2)-methyltransferase
MDHQKIFLKDLSFDKLVEFCVSCGEKPFRAKQLMQWLYFYRVNEFSQMKNISRLLREKLSPNADISKLPVIARQESAEGGAMKLALGLSPDLTESVESVVMFDGKRRTACLSTQLGCKFGCAYCSTALMGFRRDLTQREILGQMIALQDAIGEDTGRLTNVVFMGMGEPLDNLDTVLQAIEVLQSDFGFTIGGRKITISTCGIVPQIKALADKKTNIGLAVSLNAPNDEIRDRLVPVNKRYPIAELLKASQYYFEKTGRRVTFEYVLIDGVNCGMEQIHELRDLLTPYKCKLNLIAFNPRPGSSFASPSKTYIKKVIAFLEEGPFTVTLRKSLGSDISAACGQLYRELMEKS